MKGTDVDTVKGTLTRRDALENVAAAAQVASENARVVADHHRPTRPRWVLEDDDFSAIREALAALSESDTEGDSR